MMHLLVYRTQDTGGMGYAEMEMAYVFCRAAFVWCAALHRVPSCPNGRAPNGSAFNGNAFNGSDGNISAGDRARTGASPEQGDGAAPGVCGGASRCVS